VVSLGEELDSIVVVEMIDVLRHLKEEDVEVEVVEMVVVAVEEFVGTFAVDTVPGILVEGEVSANIVLVGPELLSPEDGYNMKRVQVGNLQVEDFDIAADIVQDKDHKNLEVEVSVHIFEVLAQVGNIVRQSACEDHVRLKVAHTHMGLSVEHQQYKHSPVTDAVLMTAVCDLGR